MITPYKIPISYNPRPITQYLRPITRLVIGRVKLCKG